MSLERVTFPMDSLAQDRGVTRHWIDYGGRDRLGDIQFFQNAWHSQFRFNGKDFIFIHKSLTQAQDCVRKEIKREYTEANKEK